MAIAGSLRSGSYTRGLVRAALDLAPAGMRLTFQDLGAIPLFNADVEVNAAGWNARLVEGERRVIVPSSHPSPPSEKGILGSKPFSRASGGLRERAADPIDWSLDGTGWPRA